MQQHGSKFFARRLPLSLGVGSKGQNSTFFEHGHVSYQIKSRMQQHASTYSVLTHTFNLWVGFKIKQNSKCYVVMLHITFRGKKYRLI